LAEISKLSKVAIADVAKVDAVLKADIANINGLTIPSGFTGLLDTYTGASAAYSVRRLSGSYTGACMRVREDGGNTETDIGFDSNGDLDTAAIASHCGVNNGYVRYWYDQSTAGGTGSGNDAGQATAASQHKIYDGTAVITKNGKPMIDATENVTSFDYFALSQSAPYTLMGVSYNQLDYNRSLGQGNGSAAQFIAARNKTALQSQIGSTITASFNHGDNVIISTFLLNGSSSFTRGISAAGYNEITGTLVDADLTTIQPAGQGSRASSIQEFILWDGALSSTDYGAIETDMDTYFSVT